MPNVLGPEDPTLAVMLVAAVVLGVAALLAPLGLFRMEASGIPGQGAFFLAFGILPLVGGVLAARDELGLLTALGAGLAPGIAFAGLVGIGSSLDIGSFGGGDSPLIPFTLVLTVPSVVLATVGFVLALMWFR